MRKNLLKIPKLAEFPIDVGILASVLKPQVPIKPLYLLLSKNPKKKNKTESHFQTTRNQNLERFSYKQKIPLFSYIYCSKQIVVVVVCMPGSSD